MYLCHERCHERGPEAVHNCRATDLMLKRKTQQELMDRHYLRKHGKNAYYGQDKK